MDGVYSLRANYTYQVSYWSCLALRIKNHRVQSLSTFRLTTLLPPSLFDNIGTVGTSARKTRDALVVRQ